MDRTRPRPMGGRFAEWTAGAPIVPRDAFPPGTMRDDSAPPPSLAEICVATPRVLVAGDLPAALRAEAQGFLSPLPPPGACEGQAPAAPERDSENEVGASMGALTPVLLEMPRARRRRAWPVVLALLALVSIAFAMKPRTEDAPERPRAAVRASPPRESLDIPPPPLEVDTTTPTRAEVVTEAARAAPVATPDRRTKTQPVSRLAPSARVLETAEPVAPAPGASTAPAVPL